MGKKTRIVAMVIALLLGLGALGYGLLRQSPDSQTPQAASSPTPSVVIQGTVHPSELPSGLPEGCPSNPQPIDDPVLMTLVTQEREMPVISVGLDESGLAAAAPPNDEGYTIAWYNKGPKVGSDMGKVVLSSHTFQFGGALGNELNEGLLEIGDVIKIADEMGNTACYRYSGNAHIMVADYDPYSDIVYDYEGRPQIAVVVCSDYTITGEALGRVIYYGDLISEAAA